MTSRHAIAAAALLLVACARMPEPATGSAPGTSPSPAASAAAGARVHLTGALSAAPATVKIQPPCGALPGGYALDLRFQVGGREYQLSVTVADYQGAGTYPAPPARVSVHTAGFGPAPPVFYAGVTGNVVVKAGAGAGTVEEDLSGDGGAAHVSAAWSCS